jgi:hypothetical protein
VDFCFSIFWAAKAVLGLLYPESSISLLRNAPS